MLTPSSFPQRIKAKLALYATAGVAGSVLKPYGP